MHDCFAGPKSSPGCLCTSALWHAACAAAGASPCLRARMLLLRSSLNSSVPSAKGRWRGWDCRLEPFPLSVGLMFHLLYFEGSSCPDLHLPSFPMWAEAKLSHGSGRADVELQSHGVTPRLLVGAGACQNTGSHVRVSGEQRNWVCLGYSHHVAFALKQSLPLLALWWSFERAWGEGREGSALLFQSLQLGRGRNQVPCFFSCFSRHPKAVHTISGYCMCYACPWGISALACLFSLTLLRSRCSETSHIVKYGRLWAGA